MRKLTVGLLGAVVVPAFCSLLYAAVVRASPGEPTRPTPPDAREETAAHLGYRLSSPETETLAVTVTNRGTVHTANAAVVVVTTPERSEFDRRPQGCRPGGSGRSGRPTRSTQITQITRSTQITRPTRTVVCPIPAGLAPGTSVTWTLPLNIDNAVAEGDRLAAGSVTIRPAVDADPGDADPGTFALTITDTWRSRFARFYAFTVLGR